MSLKRPAEDDLLVRRRYTRIRLASPSPANSRVSDTESIHSFQGYETEFVRDTSDTSSSVGFNIEFEVAEDEEQKPTFYFTDDSDDSGAAVVAELYSDIADLSCDSVDLALLGDTSEENSTSPTSNSDVDPELPRNDYLDFEKCLLCQTDRKNISYPYCSRCFTWKKNLFPSRPRRKHKLTPRNQRKLIGSNINSSNTDRDENNSTENVQCSMDSTNMGQESSISQQYYEDSGMGSSSNHLMEEMMTGSSEEPLVSEPSTSNPQKLTLGMCRVCFQKPENGVFIHLNIVHVYGCYPCAKKIWYHNGSCPICRRKIFKVGKLFV